MKARAAIAKVAATLPTRFSAEDLSVALWQQFPAELSLKGYPDHPDHHRVLSMLCGKRGVVNQGVLRRNDDGTYSAPPPPPVEMALTMPLSLEQIERMLGSRALEHYQAQQPLDVRLCEGFWGAPDDIDSVRSGLVNLEGDFILPTGRHVTPEDVQQLRTVDQGLWRLWSKRGRKTNA